MKKILLVLSLFLSGCGDHDLKIGDCFFGTDRDGKPELLKILQVGQYSAEVMDTFGDVYTTRFRPTTGHLDQVDCFDRFDGVKRR